MTDDAVNYIFALQGKPSFNWCTGAPVWVEYEYLRFKAPVIIQLCSPSAPAKSRPHE